MEIGLNRMGKRVLLLCGLVLTIYLCFRFLLPLVLPFVFAAVVSVLYYPPLRKVYHCIFTGETEREDGAYEEGGENHFGCEKKWFLVLAVGLFYTVVLFLVIFFLGFFCKQGRGIMLNFPFYQAKCMSVLWECCCQIDGMLHIKEGECYTYIITLINTGLSDSANSILPKVTGYSMQLAGQMFSILFGIIITVIATFFMIQEYDGIRASLLRSEMGRNVCRMVQKCKETLKAYVKAQGLILLLDGGVCTFAFWLARQPYFFVFGILVAVVDALPVLGAGLLLLPYTLFLLLKGEIWHAVILLLAYFACLLIRQLIEPKIIGKKTGIKPLYTIAGMYIGFRLFGIFGFLLGPVGMLIVKEVYRKMEMRESPQKSGTE